MAGETLLVSLLGDYHHVQTIRHIFEEIARIRGEMNHGGGYCTLKFFLSS